MIIVSYAGSALVNYSSKTHPKFAIVILVKFNTIFHKLTNIIFLITRTVYYKVKQYTQENFT